MFMSKKDDNGINLYEEIATYNLDGKWNDYIGVQKCVITVLKDEGFFEGNEIANEESGIIIRITAKGIKRH